MIAPTQTGRGSHPKIIWSATISPQCRTDIKEQGVVQSRGAYGLPETDSPISIGFGTHLEFIQTGPFDFGNDPIAHEPLDDAEECIGQAENEHPID